jgi:Ser/Thr protein kinase RdoA (MazF antagonist)
MDEEVLRKVLKAYELAPAQFLTPEKGYRNTSFPAVLNSGEKVNFILYKSEPKIRERILRIHAVSTVLFERQFPVRRPLRPKILKLRIPGAVRYGALYNYLAGSTIPWEGYTKNHIKLVGMALGEIHTGLRHFQTLDNSVTAEYLEIATQMQSYFKDENVLNALKNKLDLTISPQVFLQFQRVLEYCHTLPNQQALHMDFVRGNLLFRKSEPGDRFAIGATALSGILDFEKTGYGLPVIDAARTLAFLLVDCKYKSPEKIRKYFLHSGYNKRSSAVSIPFDSQLLDQLVTLFLAYDFYKFLRHNPYEFLPQNEHFTRTRDRLLTLGVIRYTKDR